MAKIAVVPRAILPEIPEATTGLPLARKEVWRVMWRRYPLFSGWSPADLQAFVDELEPLVAAGMTK